MKLLALTETYGERVIVRPAYYQGESLFFAEPQPPVDEMILLEFPGLKEPTSAAIVAWLTAQTAHGQIGTPPEPQPATPPRRQINELPPTVWRLAQLDDMLVVDNYYYMAWHLYQKFGVQAFSDFASKWLPEVQTKLQTALTTPAGVERAAALNQIQPFLDRVFTVMQQAPHRVRLEHDEIIQQLEQAQIDALHQQEFVVEHWLALAETLKTPLLLQNLLLEMADHLKKFTTNQSYVHQVLTKMRQAPALYQVTLYFPLFWQRLQYTVRLDATLSGETIDLSNATEETVALNWPVFEAQRVGRIVPGRRALVVKETKLGTVYVAGERKLKFQVARVGGRLEKFGNTLTLAAANEGGLRQALLRVEHLDTLANVDPAQALTEIATYNLPPTHPIYQAARAAPTDPRQSRILADLLIELIIGVDADVARRLLRSQSRGRR